MLDGVLLPMRAAASALSAFAILAVMLAITGIHGLVAYVVSRRRREIDPRSRRSARPADPPIASDSRRWIGHGRSFGGADARRCGAWGPAEYCLRRVADRSNDDPRRNNFANERTPHCLSQYSIPETILDFH